MEIGPLRFQTLGVEASDASFRNVRRGSGETVPFTSIGLRKPKSDGVKDRNVPRSSAFFALRLARGLSGLRMNDYRSRKAVDQATYMDAYGSRSSVKCLEYNARLRNAF